MILGMVFGYLFGTIWFVYQQGTTFTAALSLCVFPYLPGEAVKMVIAALVGPILKKRLQSFQYSEKRGLIFISPLYFCFSFFF